MIEISYLSLESLMNVVVIKLEVKSDDQSA